MDWKKAAETPNLGSEDQTDDMRPGLGWTGVANLQNFVRKGGLLVTVMDTADLAVQSGFTPGLSVAPRQRLRIVGSVVRSRLVDAASPIAYGYADNLAVYCFECTIYNLSNLISGGQRPTSEPERTTGRGSKDDPDFPQGRPVVHAVARRLPCFVRFTCLVVHCCLPGKQRQETGVPRRACH